MAEPEVREVGALYVAYNHGQLVAAIQKGWRIVQFFSMVADLRPCGSRAWTQWPVAHRAAVPYLQHKGPRSNALSAQLPR
ncbi:hypothetical protein KEU06_20325 [Pseudaminobacter sp. 19-2017]|uniref:Uncharacterized protein n=1 Tax=Pseudaminobacter soli (ex Zhang et al. 2022) TaxID=2831468 RepID=A0A942E4E8_9HYPH|nr:hypothetical protein [Pseudaminobacter soli]MBS3650963.1 hypothetical protein [Pseudaminobacter soli]